MSCLAGTVVHFWLGSGSVVVVYFRLGLGSGAVVHFWLGMDSGAVAHFRNVWSVSLQSVHCVALKIRCQASQCVPQGTGWSRKLPRAAGYGFGTNVIITT